MILGMILSPDHPWRGQAAQIGTVAFDGEVEGIASAGRAPMDLLLLDASEIESSDLDAIRAYRIARPHARIVVSLPDGGEPRRHLLSGLVAMGVYDLVQSGSSLVDALARTPTYADAARWAALDQGGATVGSRVARERVVERQVAVSQRPVLIVVGGSGYGVGTTTLAAAAARHLGIMGHHTLALDLAAVPGLIHLAGGEDFEEHHPLGPLADAMRLLPDGEQVPVRAVMALLRERKYTYLVCDVGMIGERDGTEELLREADLALIALPGQQHRRAWWEEYLRHHPLATARHVVLGLDDAEGLRVAEAFQSAFTSRVMSLRGGDARRPELLPPEGPGRTAALGAILAEVLPHGARRAPLGGRLRRTAHALLYRLGAPRRALSSTVEALGATFGRLIGGALVLAVAAGAFALLLLLGGAALHLHLAGGALGWLATRWQALTAWLRR